MGPTSPAQACHSRQPPKQSQLRWVRKNFFAGPLSCATTIGLALVLGWCATRVASWAVIHAVWLPNETACRAARDVGACWGVIPEKLRAILFGRYPYLEQWRALAASLLISALLIVSCIRIFWTKYLLIGWVIGLASFVCLMGGGLFGLSKVPTREWGGLPLTLLTSTCSIVAAFPIAVAVALGRRSKLPVIRSLCVVYIELIRGIPLISVLFLASFTVPLMLPVSHTPDVLLRVLGGITLFAAAYMAEIVRAGLQSVPLGQIEAAQSIGMRWWQTQRTVVLPQALSAVVPALVNNFIAIFKDTSLITVVSLYELTGALDLALSGDVVWRPFLLEGYLFIAAIYFAICLSGSRYSRRLERKVGR